MTLLPRSPSCLDLLQHSKQSTKLLKYASVVPLGIIFLLTTNPSEFASAINDIGVNYKAAFAVSLTLRYFQIFNVNTMTLALRNRQGDWIYPIRQNSRIDLKTHC
ncbi:MAG: energy-coupling factor transporter transrane protein EcfT [Clostridiales bacterium]|nr:energy-coupling factor transporter transrane protein EcfT [Clostridiales bacterium]